MKNMKIREELKRHGIKHWELAEALGVSEFTLTRRFRKEFSESKTKEIMEVIKRLTNEKNGGNTCA
jgi:AraC-like DNA-binding protein